MTTIKFKNEAEKLDAQRTMAFVGQMATFIRRKNLERLSELPVRFATNEARAVVELALANVHSKMNSMDLGYVDLSQGIHNSVADQMVKVVMSMSEKLGLPKLTAQDISFSVKLSEDFMTKVTKCFSTDANTKARAVLSDLGVKHNLQTHDLREMMYSIELYICVMNVLTAETEFPGYEAFIAEKMHVDGYFTKGKPIELLVHDLADLRNARLHLDGIYANPDKCLTQSVLRGAKPGCDYTVLVQKA